MSDNVVGTIGAGQQLTATQMLGINNIGALAVDPANPTTIYAGTGEANFGADSGSGIGVLKSTNGGDSWVWIAVGIPTSPMAFVGQSISKIVVTPAMPVAGTLPALPAAVYVAVVPAGANAPNSDDGVYKFTTNTATWTKLTIGTGPIIPTDMVADGRNLYVGLGNPRGFRNVSVMYGGASGAGSATITSIGSVGIFKSNDGGASWTPLVGGAPPANPRAGNRCEYCRLSHLGQEATFHMDHVIPGAAGGPTTTDNLALACVSCSLRKWANQTAADPDTGEEIPLFNPRTQVWAEHFRWDGERVVTLTPTGRATAAALALNRPVILAIRHEEAIRGRHPPSES